MCMHVCVCVVCVYMNSSFRTLLLFLLVCSRAAQPSTTTPERRRTLLGDGPGVGSKDPELQRHLEAAKRAASALFGGG